MCVYMFLLDNSSIFCYNNIVVFRGGDLVSYLALYRKYRPKSFEDFVGQEETAKIIKNEILNNKISHAYLFSGPRGTGKTSTAKIIARMINCHKLSNDGVPCGQCDSCINFNNNSDIVEIDAASNNGVDEIRELRDKVNLVPTFGKYKIYIIDEVHMLTTQAFNALLKTLEEPPAHVIFILATTEFYKIPVTVVSRCQKFQFLKFSVDEIVSKLQFIAKEENIDVSSDVLYEISRLSDGGLRDAINMLDQLSAFKNESLTIDDVYKLNGVISYNDFKMLMTYISEKDLVSIIDFLENIDKNGKSLDRFIQDFIIFLKDLLVYKNTNVLSNIKEKNNCIEFLSNMYSESRIYELIVLMNDLSVKLKNSSFSKIMLIVELMKFSNVSDKKNKFLVNDEKSLENKEIKNKITNKLTQKKEGNKLEITDKQKKIRINNTFATASKKYKNDFLLKWPIVMDKLSNDLEYVSIAGMMSDVEVLVVGEQNVMFLAKYDSLIERLFLNVDVIEKLLFSIFNIPYKAVFLANDEWEYERKNYVLSLQNSKKYIYIDESKEDIKNISDDADVGKLVSIFGNDIIKYQ